ncbi:hypothetical protein B0J18DRAFT_363310 [Chaetomium sp. MPI-SDFR-AT-0129]|nr:hypothetical protein B0J18DRAFT_363310 [Chaetomium sp. MPI-SDFR-AT-0129]
MNATTLRRRGRPAIDWTLSRKRRLLRLYLCTPEAELSLKKILTILAEEGFRPKPRHTQCLLNDMLSKSYRQKRPKNRVAMDERLAYLRSIRDGTLRALPGTDTTTINADPDTAPRRAVIKTCAILLRPNPTAGASRSPRVGGREGEDQDSTGGELDDGDSPCSPLDLRPRRTFDNIPKLESPLEETVGHPRAGSLDDSEGEISTGGGQEPGPSPAIFRNPWGGPSDDIRYEQIENLRERCRSRSSSFLADVASLLSGLSIRSSLSQSSVSVSSSRCGGSISFAEEERTGSVVDIRGDWGERPSFGGGSATGSFSWPVTAEHAPLSSTVWTSHATRDSFSDYRSYYNLPQDWEDNSHTQENQELVRFCCSKTAWCIHQRINAILMHGSPAESFTCTAAEASGCDALGNTALHVAARWAAPAPVLSRIMAMSSNPSAVNHCGETFLHVLDPSSLAPQDMAHITQYLVGRSFYFARPDETGRTCISRLLSRTSFSLESLEAIFGNLPTADRLTLFLPGPHRLVDAVRTRLLVDPTQTMASIAEYTRYFSARYGEASDFAGRPLAVSR